MSPSKYTATLIQSVRFAPRRAAGRRPLMCAPPVLTIATFPPLSVALPARKMLFGRHQRRATASGPQCRRPAECSWSLHLRSSAERQRYSCCAARTAPAGEAVCPVAAGLGRQGPRVHPVEALPGRRPADDRCAALALSVREASVQVRTVCPSRKGCRHSVSCKPGRATRSSRLAWRTQCSATRASVRT